MSERLQVVMTRYIFRHDGYFLSLSKIITFLFQGQKIGKSDAFMGLGIGESNQIIDLNC